MLTPAILQALIAGIEIMPEIAEAALTEWNLFMSGRVETPQQQQQIAAALAAVNAQLQAL
jgi:hypothetical protein